MNQTGFQFRTSVFRHFMAGLFHPHKSLDQTEKTNCKNSDVNMVFSLYILKCLQVIDFKDGFDCYLRFTIFVDNLHSSKFNYFAQHKKNSLRRLKIRTIAPVASLTYVKLLYI